MRSYYEFSLPEPGLFIAHALPLKVGAILLPAIQQQVLYWIALEDRPPREARRRDVKYEIPLVNYKRIDLYKSTVPFFNMPSVARPTQQK